jgi:hypothetical protein
VPNQELDIVEGLTPSKAEKGAVHGVGVRDVGALTTLDSFAHTVGTKMTEEGSSLDIWIDRNLIRKPL